MKSILLLIAFVFFGCTTDQDFSNQKTADQVLPVYNQNGLYNKKKNKHYVNIQWYTDYDFPTYQPYYNTITMDGVVVADFYTEAFNRFSKEVSSSWTQSTFTITQTVIGVGTSEPASLTVYKNQ